MITVCKSKIIMLIIFPKFWDIKELGLGIIFWAQSNIILSADQSAIITYKNYSQTKSYKLNSIVKCLLSENIHRADKRKIIPQHVQWNKIIKWKVNTSVTAKLSDKILIARRTDYMIRRIPWKAKNYSAAQSLMILFTNDRDWTLLYARLIQHIISYNNSPRPILILHSILGLLFPCCLCSYGMPVVYMLKRMSTTFDKTMKYLG
jgi:hypothetical protein